MLAGGGDSSQQLSQAEEPGRSEMVWRRGPSAVSAAATVLVALLCGTRLGVGVSGGDPPEWVWGVEPATASIQLDKAGRSAASSATIDIAAQRGECEAQQLWLHSPHPTTELRYFSVLKSPAGDELPPSAWTVDQVGYVFCHKSKYYTPSGGGWRPDVLLPAPDGLPAIPAGKTQPLLLTVCVPTSAAPGNYSGFLTVGAASHATLRIPVALEVWPLTLPPLSSEESFSSFYGFKESRAADWAGSVAQQRWYDLLAAHRVPAGAQIGQNYVVDDGAGTVPQYRPHTAPEFRALAASGQRWLGVADVTNDRTTGLFTASYINHTLRSVGSVLGTMRTAGVLDGSRFPVVYGFDEDKIANNKSIIQLFGAIRAAFPQVRTMSALDWPTMPQQDAIKQVLDVWVGGLWIDPQITPMR